jgi:succinyl-diaminopimelate desuccinylase
MARASEDLDFRKRLISNVDREKENLIKTCSELIQIDSSNPPGDCTGIIDLLKARYREIGADFHLVSADKKYLKSLGLSYPRNNFVAAIGPKGAKVGLAIGTHMDVVPPGEIGKWKYPPFSGKVADSKIWGRGACDAKCSLAAQLFTTKSILESEIELESRLLCIGTVDDEAPGDVTGPGMEYVVKNGLKKLGFNLPKYAINAEASGLENIWGVFTGNLTLKLQVKGRVGHPPEGINALESGVALWNGIVSKSTMKPRLVWFNGGSSSEFGLTPQKSELIFSMRLDERTAPGSALIETKAVVEKLHKSNPTIRVDELKVISARPSFNIGKNNLLVRRIASSANLVNTHTNYGGRIVGAGDLFHFLKSGVSGVTYGAGSLSRCHVANEYVSVNELLDQTRIYALVAAELCGFH